MKISFSTLGTPDWSWHEMLRRGVEYGYDGVEIRLIERETDLLTRAEFRSAELKTRRRELEESGFAVCCLASSVRFDAPDAAERERQIGIGRAYVDLATELRSGMVRVFGDVLPEAADEHARRTAMGRVADGLQALGEYAEPRGVTIVIETHGDYADSDVARATLEQVRSSAVGALWDTHHPWRFFGEALPRTYEALRPWIRHTHWKDSLVLPERSLDERGEAAAEAAHRLMSGHRHADYVPFGGGEFPALECMRLLRSGEYDGWFSLEWEKMWHPELADPEAVLPLFPSKLRQLAEWVAGGLGS